MPSSTRSALPLIPCAVLPLNRRQSRVARPQACASRSCSGAASLPRSTGRSARPVLAIIAAASIARSAGLVPIQRLRSAQSLARSPRKLGSTIVVARHSIVAASRNRSVPGAASGRCAAAVQPDTIAAVAAAIPNSVVKAAAPATSGSCMRTPSGIRSHSSPSRSPHDENTSRPGWSARISTNSSAAVSGSAASRELERPGTGASVSGLRRASALARTCACVAPISKPCGSSIGQLAEIIACRANARSDPPTR